MAPPQFKAKHSTKLQPQSMGSVPAPAFRWLVAVSFGLVQFYKLLSYGHSSFSKFCLIDFVCVAIIASLRVPRLNFKFSVWVSIYWALVTTNILLFHIGLLKLPVLFLLKLSGRQLSITSSRVRPESRSDLARQHLQGKYIINYLPESSALLTTDESLCITDSAPVYFHITLNNTTPETIVLAAQGFDGQRWTVEFNRRQLSNALQSASSDSTSHFYLPVHDIGYYRLHEVVDKSGAPVKAEGELVIVPPCPSVKLRAPSDSRTCKSVPFSSRVDVSGVPPFTVLLKNGSVLSIGEQTGEYKVSSLSEELFLDTSTAGISKLEISAVGDAFNNWVNETQSSQVDVYSPSYIELLTHKDIPLIGNPEAEFQVFGRDTPLTLRYTSPDGKQHVERISSSRHTVKLTQQGTYSFENVSGTVCPQSSIRGDKQVHAFTPPETGLNVTFEQLKDACSGPRGITADIVFKGTPPFKAWYRSLSGNRVVDEDLVETDEFEANVSFKPRSIGTYKYQVTAIQDKYRKVHLKGAQYEQVQTIREIAGASFMSGVKTTYCPDQVVHVGAQVQGKAPLRLVYEVDGKKFTQDDIQGDVTLTLGKLKGGDHIVNLKSITDVEGCTTPLDVRSPRINVRSKVATARFTGPKAIKVYSASLNLPIAISHAEGSSYKLRYTINGTEFQTKLTSHELPITQPGVYKLLEFNDGCVGQVGDEEIEVSLYERPKIKLVEHTEEVCLNTGSETVFDLVGDAPFKVWSETIDPRGKSTFDERETANSKFEVSNKPRAHPGVYTTYYWLTDKLYPKGDKSQGALVVRQRVWNDPVAVFSRPGASYNLCQDKNAAQGVPIELTGAAPFVLSVELKSMKNNKVEFRKVAIPVSGRYNLHEPLEGLDGEYQVRLIDVKDSRGCVGRAITSKASVNVKTVVAPQVNVEKQDYCVGDTIKLGVSGKGKRKLDYTLNKHKHSLATKGSTLSLLASTPGKLSLSKLVDDTQCPAVLNDTITVHDLPSSKITRQPSYNIHRGDDAIELQFAFSGVPPFTFTYTRTLDGKEVERKTISGVESHTESIYVQENGEYEVVALADAFCSVSI